MKFLCFSIDITDLVKLNDAVHIFDIETKEGFNWTVIFELKSMTEFVNISLIVFRST